MSASSQVARGYLFSFLAAVCYGIVPTLSKLLLPQAGPVALPGLAFLISGFLLLPLPPRSLPTSKSAGYIVLFGVVGAAVAPVLYQVGLNASTAVNASLLANGEALFTAIIAFGIFGERLPRKQLARGLLVVVGILIVTTNFDLNGVQVMQGLAGNLLILGSTFLWSVENNLIIPPTKRFGAALVTKYRNVLGGAIVTGAFFAYGGKVALDAQGVAYLIGTAFALAGASYFAIAALGYVGAVRAILVFSTSTVFGALFALVILHEQITAVQIAGGALILAGVFLMQRGEREVLVGPSEGFS